MTRDRLAVAVLWLTGLTVVLGLGAVLLSLVLGWWFSPDVAMSGRWGIAAWGTAQIAVVACGIGIPLGLSTALAMNELESRGRGVDTAKDFLRAMNGVPSVIYGLVGGLTVCVWAGEGPLITGLVLAAFVIPGVHLAAESGLRRVPTRRRDSARALGATPLQVLVQIVLPGSRRRIVAASLVAGIRVVGEASPLMLLGLGFRPDATADWAALPHEIYRVAVGGNMREACLFSLLFLLMVGVIQGLSSWLRRAK